MKVPNMFLLLVTILAANVYGQNDSTATARRVTPVERLAYEIRDARPEISFDTLSKDSQAVHASLPAIHHIYAERGFSRREAEEAALTGWKRLRLDQLEPTASLSPKDLINHVSGLGKLVIKSSPAGATIEFGKGEIPDKTEFVVWPSAGSYRIRLSLSGYEAVEDTCTVEEGKVTEFNRTLKKVKKN